MKSLRAKISLITICIVTVVIIIFTGLSVFFIRNTEHRKSTKLLLLLAETGKSNLDYYFNSVQKGVVNVSNYASSNLNGIDDESLEEQVEKVRDYFDEVANKTNGVLTYYYRIDPEISSNVKGFWYIDLDGRGFVEHAPTDISLYDPNDQTQLVWFNVPKYEKKAIWLAPYITDNLNVRVISYNQPIFYRGEFIGVVGIEIDYSVMAKQIDNIKLFGNGYAFLSNEKGELFYHPYIDVATLTDESKLKAPKEFNTDDSFVSYTYNGVQKEAAWLPLGNGMRINVTVPLSEMEGDWQSLVLNIIIVSAEVLVLTTLFILLYTRKISKPLKQLTEAAEQVDKGNYNYNLSYNKDDELGRLTKTFMNMSSHMREHISKLNSQVFVDSLTHVKNKAAFNAYIADLEVRLQENKELKYAAGVFDCDDLKHINDKYGHDKGDIYLISASQALCRVFNHGSIFRCGGDEFIVMFENEDYEKKDILARELIIEMKRNNELVVNEWEKVRISFGIASYDPNEDNFIDDVLRRADRQMYDNKIMNKKNSSNNE